MKLAQLVTEKSPPTTRPKIFSTNIEKDTVTNTDYRRVLFTTSHSQLVVMSINPGEEIGEEIHDVDQFIRVDKGVGTAIMNGKKQKIQDGDALVVPAGAKHNIINTGRSVLKIYTLYTPPEHNKDTVQKTKNDEHEDSFDGSTDI